MTTWSGPQTSRVMVRTAGMIPFASPKTNLRAINGRARLLVSTEYMKPAVFRGRGAGSFFAAVGSAMHLESENEQLSNIVGQPEVVLGQNLLDKALNHFPAKSFQQELQLSTCVAWQQLWDCWSHPCHLDAMAIAKLVESPKATEHAATADKPTSTTGLRPIVSEARPQTYAVRKRPNVNELAM